MYPPGSDRQGVGAVSDMNRDASGAAQNMSERTAPSRRRISAREHLATQMPMSARSNVAHPGEPDVLGVGIAMDDGPETVSASLRSSQSASGSWFMPRIAPGCGESTR